MRPKYLAPDGEAFRQKVARIAAPQVSADAAIDVTDALKGFFQLSFVS